MDAGEARLTLTIVPGSDPIAGRIRLEDGAELSFCGYMQLAAALERIREGMPTPGADDPDDR